MMFELEDINGTKLWLDHDQRDDFVSLCIAHEDETDTLIVSPWVHLSFHQVSKLLNAIENIAA
jgi:hypothetical protein